MHEGVESEHWILETRMGDLCLSTVPDQGFLQHYSMAPELHSHSYYEVLFSPEGGFSLELSDGDRVLIETGALCLIPPGVYHATRPLAESSKKLALRFHYSRHAEFEEQESLHALFSRTMAGVGGILLFSEDAALAGVLGALQAEILHPQTAMREYVAALLSQFYLLLMRRIERQASAVAECMHADVGSDREQRRIWIDEYFQDYYAQPITEADLAERICLSRRQVSRVLREIYGRSFRQILIDVRLNRAAQLLLITDHSVETIAELVGYDSLSGFYTAFRKKFAITAAKYRKSFANRLQSSDNGT